ncbi:MAG: hypothetical protein BIFFINMI_04343 [Phycisphaerae bacterium]|nr:hypothetical protein [Phycisphaerae bacterium]
MTRLLLSLAAATLSAVLLLSGGCQKQNPPAAQEELCVPGVGCFLPGPDGKYHIPAGLSFPGDDDPRIVREGGWATSQPGM